MEIAPVSNYPEVHNYDGGMPTDATVSEIFALRRDLDALRRDLRAANKKITKALETLHSTRRFIRLGIFEQQWETYDELKRRLSNIDGTLAMLDDPMGGIEGGEIEIPDRWKKRD